MSLWWMLGGGGVAVDTGDEERNAPSLWSAGWVWGPTDEPGRRFYWQASSVAQAGRTGVPELCVAIGGRIVLEQLASARWSLGRSDWLSVLSPTTASLSFVGEPAASVGDEVVVSLMSDLKAHHSDALWVGRVSGRRSRRDLDGQVTSTIAATDVIGTLAKAPSPPSIEAGHTLVTLVEELAAGAGVALRVDVDPLVALPVLTGASELTGSVLDLVNRAERSSNALLFLRGRGRLYAAMRDATGAAAARVVTLDGADSPSSWEEDESLGNVVTRWVLGDGSTWATDTAATTLDEYGDQAYSATDMLATVPDAYADLIASDVMARPRVIVTDASFHVRDHSNAALTIDPLDRVVYDGSTYQVMGVSHEVSPLRLDDGTTVTDWRVTISADATQEALAGAPDPGPVEPPGLHEVTFTTICTKSMYVRKQGSSETGDATSVFLPVGYDTGVRQRGLLEFAPAWPAGFLRVTKARLRIKTYDETSVMGNHPRIYVRRATEAWTESGSTKWPGPSATSADQRIVSIPRAANRWVEIGITAIAARWPQENNGLRLQAVDEDKAYRRTMFWSDDADEADRPRLVLTCEVIE